jgi:hypothetical protein
MTKWQVLAGWLGFALIALVLFAGSGWSELWGSIGTKTASTASTSSNQTESLPAEDGSSVTVNKKLLPVIGHGAHG